MTKQQNQETVAVIPDEPEFTLAAATEQGATTATMAHEPDINVEATTTDNGEIVVQQQEEENLHTKRQLRGAAIAGGLTGLLVGGPLVGVVAAGGAVLAVTSKGKVGDMARSGGEAAAKVGDRIRQKLPPKNHPVLEKTSQRVTQSREWAVKRFTPKTSNASAASQT
jgi:hypothetical protein